MEGAGPAIVGFFFLLFTITRLWGLVREFLS